LKPFIFLDVSILREYLAIELSVPQHSFPFSLERAIDDWVFLIFFVGNDFLPHLPSLEIREGAIDTLMGIWKQSLERMGGYLTEHGKVRLERAQVILEQLAMREDEIFRKRREGEFALLFIAHAIDFPLTSVCVLCNSQPRKDKIERKRGGRLIEMRKTTLKRIRSSHQQRTILNSEQAILIPEESITSK